MTGTGEFTESHSCMGRVLVAPALCCIPSTGHARLFLDPATIGKLITTVHGEVVVSTGFQFHPAVQLIL